MSFEILAP